MKRTYENTFIQGRELTKKLLGGSVVSCVLSLIFGQISRPVQSVFFALTVILFVSTIYVMAKYCRCPHCGRHIFLGVLAISVCPGCRRSLVTGKKVKKSK